MATTPTARPTTPRRGADAGPATRTVVATFGVLAALAGIEHGLGELAQGSVAPPGLVFASWPDVPALDVLSGEPAMTLVPDLVVTGVASIVVAVALGTWSIVATRRAHGGLVLIALSVLLLLVGGGFGPPLIGVILGSAASRRMTTTVRPPGGVSQALGRRWRWFLAAGVAGFLALMPGTVLLHTWFGVASAGLVSAFAAVAFGGLILALISARAHDTEAGRPLQPGHRDPVTREVP